MPHFHQEVFPQFTVCLVVCCCCLVAKLCATLCNAMDCSVHETSQARILEWVAISSSRVLFFFNIYLLTDLATPGLSCKLGIFSCGVWTLSCSTWDLDPCPGIKPGPSALGVWSLSHWTTRDVPQHLCSGLPSFPRWLTYSFIFLQLVGVFFFWHMRLPARWTWKVIWKALAL